ncbi:MAG TPA: class I SAM-dependent methyltransferase [Patescibacteria group bacterium]|nr:class I SAM-dependent methyltransferase [Patescibacteria group bacterium]
MNKTNSARPSLEEVWHQVPPDYYQKGTEKNILQKIWHTAKLHAVLELIKKTGNTPKRILDVGCASGWFLSNIAGQYPKAQCTGIDVYKDAIEYGKRKYKNLHLHHHDGHKLPFRDGSFDLIICTEVLEHVVDPDKVLQEIKRVLARDGIAIVEMDTGNLLFRLVWYWWTHIRNGVWKDAHIQTFNTKRLEAMISDAGFSITEKKLFTLNMAVAFLLGKNNK